MQCSEAGFKPFYGICLSFSSKCGDADFIRHQDGGGRRCEVSVVLASNPREQLARGITHTRTRREDALKALSI